MKNEIVLFEAKDGSFAMPVQVKAETVWLSLSQMAQLFERDKTVVFRHVKNAIADGEIDPKVTIANFAMVTPHGAVPGKTRVQNVDCYNLDVIISADSALFGNEKDGSFKSALGAVYQSFGGKDLYPSAQEKAANLLYLVTKNHGFSDGNKRIAAGLFLYFLKRNRLLLRKDGSKRIADHTLVALTVMIAESKPQEKEMMVNLVMTFLA